MRGDLGETFALAAGRSGETHERKYRVGGRSILLRYAGTSLLERLSPSIEHLRTETADENEHVVHLWDGAASDVGPPPAADGSHELPDTGLAVGERDGARLIYEVGLRALSAIDVTADRSWYWVADSRLLPEWSTSTPLRHVFHAALATRGCQVVHASAVGRLDGGVLIAGRSGSGKSTSALSTLGTDLLFAGDDYVGVSLGGESPFVHSLYGCGKLEADHIRRFPNLRIVASPERSGTPAPWREKTIFYVRDSYPAQLTKGFPLKAIVIPRISPEESSKITELSLAATIRTLVPSTMFEIHGTGQTALTTLVRAAERVATLELRVGKDVQTIPALIDGALDRLR